MSKVKLLFETAVGNTLKCLPAGRKFLTTKRLKTPDLLKEKKK